MNAPVWVWPWGTLASLNNRDDLIVLVQSSVLHHLENFDRNYSIGSYGRTLHKSSILPSAALNNFSWANLLSVAQFAGSSSIWEYFLDRPTLWYLPTLQSVWSCSAVSGALCVVYSWGALCLIGIKHNSREFEYAYSGHSIISKSFITSDGVSLWHWQWFLIDLHIGSHPKRWI